MADWPPLKNAAFTVTFPIYDNDGDLVSGAAGLDSEVSIDGGTFADATNEATEIATSSGIYTLALTAAEMNGDIISVITKTSTTDAKTAVNVMYTVVRQLQDLAFPATSGRSLQVETDGMVHADVKEWLGAAPNALAAGRVDASVGAMATDVLTAAALAADAVDEIWDEALSGHTTFGSVGQLLNALGAQFGRVNDVGPTASDFDTDSFTEATNGHFDGHVLIFTSGVLKGQGRIISTYTGAGQNVAFDRAFTEAPADTDEFVILGPLAGGLTRLIATEADGHAHADLKEWLGAAPNALITGRVDANTQAMATGVIAAATFAAGAIDAAAIAGGAIDAATFAAGAIDDAALAADAFDGLFIRDVDQVEASAPVHSLTTAVLKAVSRIRDNAGTLEIYRTDGLTIHASQTVTSDATLDPIDELTAAA